jgi:predicted metal-dependent hydrolase
MRHEIQVRRIPFAFDDAIDPVWHPQRPEWSHMVNGASLAMPYLEPFLIRNVREALPQISDERLQADARAFVEQEAQHYTNHRRYNEMLKAAGYPQLAGVEQTMKRDFERLGKRSLAWRLAYTAGFESMTAGITEWLIRDRQALFEGADPRVASLILWHMVEETEHKTVAFDIYQAVSGNWPLRVLGLLQASVHVALLSRRAYRTMLKRDGRWRSVRSRLRLWRQVGGFVVAVGPAIMRAMAPGHDPRNDEDPDWVDTWRTAYDNLEAGTLPVLGGAALRPQSGSEPPSGFFRTVAGAASLR